MLAISPRSFRSTIREPSAKALALLAPHSKEIFAKWKHELRSIGIASPDYLGQSVLDFERFSDGLRKISFQAFCRQIQKFGSAMAECGVDLDRSTDALNRFFDLCVPYLMSQPEAAASILALARLHALIVHLIVSDSTKPGHMERKAPSQTISIDSNEQRRGASIYVTKVYEEERRRLSRDLHDEVGHDLVLMKLYLEMIALDTNKKQFQAIRPRLSEAIALVSHAIDSVRRLVLDLGPAVFDDLGFLPAVRTYTSQFSARTKIAVSLREGYLPENIPMSHQVALYRLLQGALSNVLKHACAKSVKVSLGCMKDSVVILVIQDDGRGFDTTVKPGSRSFGLTAMRERVEVLGGRIHIQSMPAGSMSKIRGTRIEVDLPLTGETQ